MNGQSSSQIIEGTVIFKKKPITKITVGPMTNSTAGENVEAYLLMAGGGGGGVKEVQGNVLSSIERVLTSDRDQANTKAQAFG